MYIKYNNSCEYISEEDLEQVAASLGFFFVLEKDRVSVIIEDNVLEFPYGIPETHQFSYN